MTLSVAELVAAALDPAWADRQDASALFVELEGAPTLEADDRQAVERWIDALPVPVIGCGGDGSWPAGAMDVLAGSDDDLLALEQSIRANPAACAVLVQVLRSTAGLDPIQALTVESLAYATLQAGSEFASWLAERRSVNDARVLPPGDDRVLVDRDDSLLRVQLNSPESRNSLSAAMRDGLTEAFALVAMDPGIERVVVSANGPNFCSGGDLEEFGLVADPQRAHEIRMRRMPARYLAPEAHRYHFAVHGACIGAGIELPAFAARLTAAEDAVFRLPEIAMGLIPGAGGCVSIPRRIGRQRAAFMAITGAAIDAGRALDWGLVDEIL